MKTYYLDTCFAGRNLGMWSFVRAYIKSMRLYYAFITGIAGWLGIAYYEFAAAGSPIGPSLSKKVLILIILFLSWGINQIFNDFLGLKEDRINAPDRPMVTGELDPKKALVTSCALLLISFALIWVFLEPIAIIPALLGVLLNILYEYAKGYRLWGNVVFGLMIMMCPVVGYLASGPILTPYVTSGMAFILLLVCTINGLMTFYTFFKDYQGDRAAGKETIVVKYGIEKSRYLALGAAFIPAILFLAIYLSGFSVLKLNSTFIFLAVLTLLLQIRTGFLYFKYPFGERTYYSLSVNFQACACGQASLIAFFDPRLSLMLFIVSYMFVGFLFNLYDNSKA